MKSKFFLYLSILQVSKWVQRNPCKLTIHFLEDECGSINMYVQLCPRKNDAPKNNYGAFLKCIIAALMYKMSNSTNISISTLKMLNPFLVL